MPESQLCNVTSQLVVGSDEALYAGSYCRVTSGTSTHRAHWPQDLQQAFRGLAEGAAPPHQQRARDRGEPSCQENERDPR